MGGGGVPKQSLPGYISALKVMRIWGFPKITVDGGNLAPPKVPKVLGITIVQGP